MTQANKHNYMRLVPFGVVAILAIGALILLPPGVCRHDCADIQMASTTLGIAHPPGYALLTLVGHVFARCVPSNPAYGVSLMNWAAGVMLLVVTASILRRLQIRTAVIATVIALLPCYPVFWDLWCSPEVYMLVLAMLSLVVYSIMRWHDAYRLRWIVIAALCLGFVAATRTNMWLYVPPAIAAVFLRPTAPSREEETPHPRRKPWRILTLAGLCFLIPILTSLSYIWLRDVPTTKYNYISQMTTVPELFEPEPFSTSAKQARLVWLVTARQYWDCVHPQPREMWHKATRTITETDTREMLSALVVLALAGGGAVWLARRNQGILALLVGIFLANLAFIAIYTVQDISTMALPLLWSRTLLATCGLDATLAGLSRELAPRQLDPAPKAAIVIATAAFVFAVSLCGYRIHAGQKEWASPPDIQIDWTALPENAYICSGWTDYPALCYQCLIEANRTDIRVSVPPPGQPWSEVVLNTPGPIYFTRPSHVPEGYATTPEHGLWRVRIIEPRPTVEKGSPIGSSEE